MFFFVTPPLDKHYVDALESETLDASDILDALDTFYVTWLHSGPK